ncbi:MAG TPA: hypothetical protein VGM50_09195 [Gemmatimonadaceae bacterium]
MIRLASATVVGFGAIAIAACGSDSSTSPTGNNLDVSSLVAATSTANFTAGSRALVSLPSDVVEPTINPSLCPFSTANQDFECSAMTASGLTFTTDFTLLDASGHSLSQAVAGTVDQVRAIVDVGGTLSTPTNNASITISSHSDNTLSGILANNRMLNGTSHEHDSVTTGASGSTSRTVLDATTTTANLQIPTTAGQWPATGTITSDVNTKSTIGSLPTVTSSAHFVTTFNGTSTVTAVLTVSGHTTTCQIDLSGKTAASCS